MVVKTVAALERLGTAGRGIAEAVSFGLAHRIRIEILAALHEGPASSSELSDTLRQPLSTIDHHVKELLKDGSIEIAEAREVGNVVQHFYCMVKLPFYSDEDVAAMTPDERQALAGLILQASMAEALASLWAGKITSDPRVMLAWNRINLDERGRDDLADEQVRSLERQHEIEAEATNRLAETGELGIAYIITLFGYERSRTSAPEPMSSEKSSPVKRTRKEQREHKTLVAKTLAALRRLGTAGRSVAETVSFAIAHRIRIEILAALHEGPASSKELANTLRQPRSTVDYHIKELLKDGSIEIARTEKVGNLVQHFYCMVKLPFYSDEDVAAMTPDERQALAGLILQASMAEALSSLWAGKILSDPRVMLAWNRINLDEQGRDDLADEQTRSWARQHEIEAESANRLAETGEQGVTYVITSFGYERSRTSAPEPMPPDSATQSLPSGNYLSESGGRSTGDGSSRNV
jgi:DNA-binding transcriptional ArsR family regulator